MFFAKNGHFWSFWGYFESLEGYKLTTCCIISCNSIEYVNINQIFGHSWKFYWNNTHFLATKSGFFCKELSFCAVLEVFFEPLEGYKLCRFCIISCNAIEYVNTNQNFGHSWKFYQNNTYFFAKKCVLLKTIIFSHFLGYFTP